MDGFHLSNVELSRLGLADRKGAPETFDAAKGLEVLLNERADLADAGTHLFTKTAERQFRALLTSKR